ncbi:hypothetical protein ACFVVM_16790 [Nocardia sp. NPDC058176]|uniref:hypothetical protein n=1 Tax=Nocardia sp. NPDC058176 TaxID=3346368 RepID=UPI0036D869E9
MLSAFRVIEELNSGPEIISTFRLTSHTVSSVHGNRNNTDPRGIRPDRCGFRPDRDITEFTETPCWKESPMSKKKNATTTPAPETDSGTVAVPVLRSDADRALWAALGDNPGSTAAALADAAGIGASTARRVLVGWESAGAARSATDPTSPRAAKTWTAEPATPVPTEPEPATPEAAAAETATPEPISPEPAAPESATPEPDPADPTTPEPVSSDQDAPASEPAAPASAEPAGEVEPTDPAPDSAPDTAVAAPTGDDPTDAAPVTPVPPAEPAATKEESTVERLPAGALRGQVEDYLRDNPGKEYTPHQIGKELGRSSGAVHNALVKLTKDGTARQTSTAPKKFALAS